MGIVGAGETNCINPLFYFDIYTGG
jgi:hypothetical protein